MNYNCRSLGLCVPVSVGMLAANMAFSPMLNIHSFSMSKRWVPSVH